MVAALAATITASCGAGSEKAEGPPLISATPTVTSVADSVLPLDAYTLSAEEDRTVGQALHLLIRQCGQRFGVDVRMGPPDNPSLIELSARRFGIIDAGEAARFGYNWPPSSPLHEDDKGSGEGWDPGPLERLVVQGQSEGSPEALPKDRDGRPLPDGGCAAEAERTFGLAPAGLFLANDLAREAGDQAEADPRVQQAFDGWSTCMKRRGYTYKTPWEPNDAKWPEPATSQEIATAQADVACRRETNLVGVWYAVERAYQQRLIDAHAEELAGLQEWRDERVRRANQVLGG